MSVSAPKFFNDFTPLDAIPLMRLEAIPLPPEADGSLNLSLQSFAESRDSMHQMLDQMIDAFEDPNDDAAADRFTTTTIDHVAGFQVCLCL
jgi:hypothetical protein